MAQVIKLNFIEHQGFLSAYSKESLYGYVFMDSDQVIVCATCKKVWRIQTWSKENACQLCQGIESLPQIPGYETNPDVVAEDTSKEKVGPIIEVLSVIDGGDNAQSSYLLKWEVRNAEKVWITPIFGEVAHTGCHPIPFALEIAFRLVAIDAMGFPAEASVPFKGSYLGPKIELFEPESYTILSGLSTRVFWRVHGATDVYLEFGTSVLGHFENPIYVSPAKTTTFTLIAYNQDRIPSRQSFDIEVISTITDQPLVNLESQSRPDQTPLVLCNHPMSLLESKPTLIEIK